MLLGDFNAEPGAPELAPLFAPGAPLGLRDVTDGVEVTFHGFYYGSEPPAKIDYIFATPELACRRLAVWRDEADGVYLSDHYPLCAALERR